MLDNNWDLVEIFESKLAQFCGFTHAVTTDCCTNAILISLEMLNQTCKIRKDDELFITKYTYLSVPMTLRNNGWNVRLVDYRWTSSYQLGSTGVFDAATDMKEHMSDEYADDDIVCISFQQKKRLPLGRGGAILTNNGIYTEILKRMRYDGRDPRISDRDEVIADTIVNGYHCYMEPDKAAKGILALNQPSMMLPYIQHSWKEYNDISRLSIFRNAN